MYTTIRLDIKKSRKDNKFKQMKSFLEEIDNRLEKLNHKHLSDKQSSLIKLQIRNGDELFGIYSDMDYSFKVIEAIIVSAQKLKIYIYLGIGIGPIDMDENISKEDAHSVNGQSIWNATSALEEAKKSGSYGKKNTYKLITNFKKDVYNTTIKYLFSNALNNLEKRTTDQQLAIDLKRMYPDAIDADLYLKLKPQASNNKSETNRVNFIRFITRADVDSYNTAINCIVGIAKDQGALT